MAVTTFNQTKVELKSFLDNVQALRAASFNQIKVELKSEYLPVCGCGKALLIRPKWN